MWNPIIDSNAMVIRGRVAALLAVLAWPGLRTAPAQLTATQPATVLRHYELAVAGTLAERYPRSFADRDAYEAHRRELVARMKDALAWDAYSRDWPLNARQVGQVDRGDYVIEKIVFESVPGLNVPALVYRPSRAAVPASGRRAAILNPYGHWAHGKWERPVQARCIAAAKLGYVALIYDPLCQGERSWMKGGHEPHRPGILLAGHTMLGLMFWETSRALDYLLTRDDVDPTRIACTGASGGGLNAVYTALVDDRIAVAAPCVYATDLAGLVRRGKAGCCAYLPNHALLGELDDVYAGIAPRPLLILGAKKDLELCATQDQIVGVAARTYGLYDAARLANFADPESGHDYSKAMRERFYAWCARWLDGRADAGDRIAEPPTVADEIVPPDDERLRVYRGEADRGVSLWEIDRRVADQRCKDWLALPTAADDVPRYRKQLADRVAALMGDFPREPAPARLLGETTFHAGKLDVTRFSVETEPHMRIPVTRYRDPSKPARRVVIWLEFADDAATTERHQQLESLTGDGDVVFHVEPRATGSARPESDDDALYSMGLAKPIFGGRVHDVRAAKRFVERAIEHDAGVPIAFVAVGGEACSVASVCALFDDYDRIVLHRPIAGWHRYLEKEIRPEYTAFLPLQLKVCDLPELWAALAPTPLTIAQVMDVDDRPASSQHVSAMLVPARRIYELVKASGCLTYDADAGEAPVPSEPCATR